MFTIKFYSGDGCRQLIREVEHFTVLRCPSGPDDDGTAEITMHTGLLSSRIDIGDDSKQPDGFPPRFAKAIIENSAGRTTEIITYKGGPYRSAKSFREIKQEIEHGPSLS